MFVFFPVWLTTQSHSKLATEAVLVPFLPVNPEYSSTRNQASLNNTTEPSLTHTATALRCTDRKRLYLSRERAETVSVQLQCRRSRLYRLQLDSNGAQDSRDWRPKCVWASNSLNSGWRFDCHIGGEIKVVTLLHSSTSLTSLHINI